MKILVACEYSGRVREAFRAHGHDAWSCDISSSMGDNTHHIRGDVRQVLGDGWDLMVAHPPCTYLSISGGRAGGLVGTITRENRGPSICANINGCTY